MNDDIMRMCKFLEVKQESMQNELASVLTFRTVYKELKKRYSSNERIVIDPAVTIEKLTKKLEVQRLKGSNEEDPFDQITYEDFKIINWQE